MAACLKFGHTVDGSSPGHSNYVAITHEVGHVSCDDTDVVTCPGRGHLTGLSVSSDKTGTDIVHDASDISHVIIGWCSYVLVFTSK